MNRFVSGILALVTILLYYNIRAEERNYRAQPRFNFQVVANGLSVNPEPCSSVRLHLLARNNPNENTRSKINSLSCKGCEKK